MRHSWSKHDSKISATLSRPVVVRTLVFITQGIAVVAAVIFAWQFIAPHASQALLRTNLSKDIAKQTCDELPECKAIRLQMWYDRSAHQWEPIANVSAKTLDTEKARQILWDTAQEQTRFVIYRAIFKQMKVVKG